MLKRWSLQPSAYDDGEPSRRLVEFARSNGIPIVDLLPSLEAAQDEEQGEASAYPG